MKWFKHDSDAHTDAKLQKVQIKYGFAGYGIYWYCLEMIAKQVNEHTLTFELEHDSEILAHMGGMDSRQVEEIMQFMVALGLFENTDGRVTCMKMLKRLDQSMTSNPHMRKILSSIKNHDGVMTPSDIVMTESGKVMQDKIRLDKSRLDKNNKTPSSSSKKNDRVPVAEIISLYHEILPNHPSVQKVTKAREGNIKQRWREDLPTIDQWRNFFDYISQSQFLTGAVPARNGQRPFIATLEWVTKAANYTKILEGYYHGV